MASRAKLASTGLGLATAVALLSPGNPAAAAKCRHSYNTQTESQTDFFFAVRAASINRPVTDWSQDDC